MISPPEPRLVPGSYTIMVSLETAPSKPGCVGSSTITTYSIPAAAGEKGSAFTNAATAEIFAKAPTATILTDTATACTYTVAAGKARLAWGLACEEGLANGISTTATAVYTAERPTATVASAKGRLARALAVEEGRRSSYTVAAVKARLARRLAGEKGRPSELFTTASGVHSPERPTATVASGKGRLDRALAVDEGRPTGLLTYAAASGEGLLPGLLHAGKDCLARALSGAPADAVNPNDRRTGFLPSTITAIAGEEGGLPGLFTTANLFLFNNLLAWGLDSVLLSGEQGKRRGLGLPAVLLTRKDGKGHSLGLPALLVISKEVKRHGLGLPTVLLTSMDGKGHSLGLVKRQAGASTHFDYGVLTMASRAPHGFLRPAVGMGLVSSSGTGSRRFYSSGGIPDLESEISALKDQMITLQKDNLKFAMFRNRVLFVSKCAVFGAAALSALTYVHLDYIDEAIGEKVFDGGKEVLMKRFWEAYASAHEGVAEGVRVAVNTLSFGLFGLSDEEKELQRKKDEAEDALRKQKAADIRKIEQEALDKEHKWVEENFPKYRRSRPDLSEAAAWYCFQVYLIRKKVEIQSEKTAAFRGDNDWSAKANEYFRCKAKKQEDERRRDAAFASPRKHWELRQQALEQRQQQQDGRR